MGQGVACVFERYLLKSHDIRVRGVLGRTWTVSMIVITVIPLMNEHHETGWVGVTRRPFTQYPQISPVQWTLYYLGYPNLLSGKGVVQ